MNVVDGVKAGALLFLAAIMQVSIFAQVHILGGVPDVLLVMLVAVALLRGAIVGAAGGFFAGLLVDTASLVVDTRNALARTKASRARIVSLTPTAPRA